MQALHIDSWPNSRSCLRSGGASENAALGDQAGPEISAEALVPAIDRLVGRHLEVRSTPKESFIETYRRLGAVLFKDAMQQGDARHAAWKVGIEHFSFGDRAR